MTAANLAVLLVAVALAATGQLLLKHGMNGAAERARSSDRSLLVTAATSPWVLGGLAVFALSAVAWLLTLSRVPLSQAYPFNALGFLVILLASSVLLREHTNVWTWLGTGLVVGGLVVVVTLSPAGSGG
ncbi:EamA family transporter [Nakamurella endophytica]|uniref:EamA family transporter n=1 Tax=Nakamurella endophytica TaxID=1748367 RepID=UPI001669394E|nr:EamA family transporter [Nakamurella endophytica]